MKRRASRIAAVVTAIGIAAGGCALSVPPAPIAQTEYRPVALTIVPGPFAPGTKGRMVGYLLTPPVSATTPKESTQRRFTYSTEFEIVEVAFDFGRFSAEGTRRIYFHPDGARCSFADPKSFESSEMVETDKVRFSLDLGVQVMVRMVASARDARPFDYDGKVVTAPRGRQDSTILFGHFSPQFGGWLMTESG
jgi:hypothetical protein